MKKVIALGYLLFLWCTTSAVTLVLQEGTAGYTGTEDVTLFSDGKAENYSWYENSQYFGTPSDGELVATEFCC